MANIGVGKTEAEALTLSGGFYAQYDDTVSNNYLIRVDSGTGTASGTFTGATGVYQMDVAWLNQLNGASDFAVLVNGQVVRSWTGTGGGKPPIQETESFTVSLTNGATIALRGTKNGSEYAKIDSLTLTPQGANTPPVATADAYTTAVNTALTVAAAAGVLSNDSDANGDSLSASLISGVSHGSLTLNPNGSFSYTPTAGYSGPDSFTYRVSDGKGGTDSATVALTVGGATIGTGKTEAEALTLSGGFYAQYDDTVSNNYLIRVDSGTGTASGTFTGATGVYQMDVAWLNQLNGASDFAVLVNGQVVRSWTGTGGGKPPIQETESFTVSLTNGATIALRGTKNGSEYAKIDSLTLTPQGANTPPVATADAYTTAVNTALTVAAAAGVLSNDSDANGDSLSASLISGVSHGSLTLNPNGSFSYTPTAGYSGPDSFTYRVSDGKGGTDSATVALTVGGATIGTGKTEAEALTLSGGFYAQYDDTVSNNYLIRVDSGTGTASGTFTGATGVYQMDVAWLNQLNGASDFAVLVNGQVVRSWTGTGGGKPPIQETESFTVSLTNGATIALRGTKNGSEYAKIDSLTLTPQGANTPPVATADAYTTAVNTALTVAAAAGVLSNDSDANGDSLSASLISGVSHGSLTLNPNGSFSYTPTAGYSGPDSFTYRVSDGKGGTDSATVALTVGGATIGTGKTEAEALTLSGGFYAQYDDTVSNNYLIRVDSGTGTASGTFTGATGVYQMDVAWLNQLNGASDFAVLVNGQVVRSWTGTGGGKPPIQETESFTVSLTNGATIALRGTKNGSEYAKIDSLTLTPQGGDPGSATIGTGTTQAEALHLTGGYAVETLSSGPTVIKATGTGTAAGTFTGASGKYWLDVTWLNEPDGAATYKVLVNGQVVETWTGTGGNGMGTDRMGLELRTGDVITLRGTQDSGEYARIDKIALSARSATIAGLNADDFDFFAFAGQSNAERHFSRQDGDNSAGPMGFLAFEQRVEQLTGGVTTAIEAATGGSASNEYARKDGLIWWNLGQNKPGQCLLDSVAAIQSALAGGKTLDGIIWSQGETDAFSINRNNDPQTEQAAVTHMLQAMDKIFAYYWSIFGTVPIFIQELGPITDPDYDGLDALRDAQANYAATHANVYMGADTTGGTLFDALHFTVDSYNDIATDLANSAVNTLLIS